MAKGYDVEMGIPGALYPTMMESPQLRWAFIRKVYSIVTLQILITISISAAFIFYPPISDFFLSRTTPAVAALVLITISPFIVMLPMMFVRERHPWNLILLGLFTICMSMVIGLGCVTRSGKVIIEAAALTFVVVVALTLYTFWAAKRGHDFNFLGPFLTVALLVMMIYLIVQIFFPVGRVGTTIYGCLAALVFAGFIIYDTDNLIKRHSYDEYVCASITLYLDIINLFLSILTVFSAADS